MGFIASELAARVLPKWLVKDDAKDTRDSSSPRYSKTFQGIAACILPLEHWPLSSTLDPTLSLLNYLDFVLDFFVSNGELESKNLRSMVINTDQCTGTMIWLSSQLVLRYKDSTFASLPRSRCVVIPRGHVHFRLSWWESCPRTHWYVHWLYAPIRVMQTIISVVKQGACLEVRVGLFLRCSGLQLAEPSEIHPCPSSFCHYTEIGIQRAASTFVL